MNTFPRIQSVGVSVGISGALVAFSRWYGRLSGELVGYQSRHYLRASRASLARARRAQDALLCAPKGGV